MYFAPNDKTRMAGRNASEESIVLRKEIPLDSQFGKKRILVYQGDITEYPYEIDLMTISAFRYNYAPSYGTVIGALEAKRGISTQILARNAELDLRDFCGCWISGDVLGRDIKNRIRRLGCIEMGGRYGNDTSDSIMTVIQSYFRALEIAGLQDIPLTRIVMPLLGTGNQGMEPRLMVVPLISEAVDYLKRSPVTNEIVFIEHSRYKADILVNALDTSYSILNEMSQKDQEISRDMLVFISHSEHDREIAELLSKKLEERGIKAWYAPRDINQGNYAKAIVSAISACTHFVTVISSYSMESEHVLNEIDLAFDQLKRGIVLLPFRIDYHDLRPEFSYYLKRQQWIEAQKPPMEIRIEEFIDKVFKDDPSAPGM